MIKHCLLYKAMLHGSKVRSSERHCREEGETETESGMETGMGVGGESRIVEENPISETERGTERNPKRETKRETKRNPKRETEQETKWNPKRETRKRGNEATWK